VLFKRRKKKRLLHIDRPLHEQSDVAQLLNWSKLVKGWLLCNKGKKLKFGIQLKVISTNLQISREGYKQW